MLTYRAGLRPTMSVTRPLMGDMSVWARRYDVAIHEYCEGVAESSAAMVGKAVEMIWRAVSLGVLAQDARSTDGIWDAQIGRERR